MKVHFCVSLHPEIFYAIQTAGKTTDERYRLSERLRGLARAPVEPAKVTIPPMMWAAVADAPALRPVDGPEALTEAIEAVSEREFQVRVLTGLLHSPEAVERLVDGDERLERVIASLPKGKREWLVHMGVYPLGGEASLALESLLREPGAFRTSVARRVEAFWDAGFGQIWEGVGARLADSVARKRQVFESQGFGDFLRHTLLPIEIDERRQRLLALRGGGALALDEIGRIFAAPSLYNDSRFWTTTPNRPRVVWLPYLEPEIAVAEGLARPRITHPDPDIALILKALGDATRFAMVCAIARRPSTASELADLFAVSKPTVTHHLHLLREAGLVVEQSHGAARLILLRRNVVEQLGELAVQRIFDTSAPLRLTKTRSSP